MHTMAVFQRHIKRDHFTWKDRIVRVLAAGRLPAWRQALLTVHPDTILYWNCDLFKRFFRHKSRLRGDQSPLNPETD